MRHDGPGRATPSAALPDPSTELGRFIIELNQMTCEEQVSLGVFNGINLATMETFGIRDSLVQEVEAFPFVTVP